jgi:hypothetical protein
MHFSKVTECENNILIAEKDEIRDCSSEKRDLLLFLMIFNCLFNDFHTFLANLCRN